MIMVYDLILNFSKIGLFIDFYEWNKNDNMIIIEKIPIFRIGEKQFSDIINSSFKVDIDFLSSIYNKTYSEIGFIDYTCLVTDMSRVVALKFNKDGITIEKSSLLLDEEQAIIDENNDIREISFNYRIIESFDNVSFFTRREKKIQNYLINEIKRLFILKVYDEIEYLYYEIFSRKRNINKMYSYLLNYIENNYNEKIDQLYSVVRMIPLTNVV